MLTNHAPSAPASSIRSIAVILIVGAVVLAPRLGAQSLWLDEGLTITPAVTATSVADLVHRVRELDTQPPASHLVLYALSDRVPRSEFFYRLPSFVALELGLVMLFLFVRRLWGPSVALVATAIAQLSPFLGFYGAEARNYSLWFMLIAASALAAVHWVDAVRTRSASRWTWALALALANALGLWTHLFHVFVILAQGVVLLGVAATEPTRRRAQPLAILIAAEALTVLLFMPWLLVVMHAASEGTAGVSWTRPFGLGSLAYYLFAAHFGSSLGPDLRSLHVHPLSQLARTYAVSLGLAGAAICVTLAVYSLLVRDALRIRERRWELLALIVWPVCALAGPIAYGWLRSFPLHPRHLMVVWPLLPIVLALGLVRYPRLRPLLVASLLLQLVALGNLLFDGRYAKDDERGAVRYAEQHSTAPAYVIGDVANLYATRLEGRPKGFVNFPPDAHDVWLVDNRTWEDQSRRTRAQLKIRMRAMGMRYDGGVARFRGIVLRHWTRARS
ncbi:MAG TPA: glycosyltransferase family 39 protein [Candidatus Binatia bacterium]